MASVSLAVLSSNPVLAQEQPAGRVPSAQDEITVSAERTPSTVYNSPGTVTVITDRDIDRNMIQGPRDVPRTEPGIAVSNSPTRAGAGNYYIRGIGDNRVRLEVDGVRVPETPGTNTSASLYTRDFVDYDSLKRVEIIRGPASALYGSDAIGGVVSFVTKDPADYLREVGRDWYAGTKLSYNSVDRSFSQTYTGAARQGPWEFLLQYTRRDGHETDINSRLRSPNPQDYQSNNILSKLIYETPDSGRWRLTFEAFWRHTHTDIQSERSASIRDSFSYDKSKRFRVSLDWTQQLAWAIADEVKVLGYLTDLQRREAQDQVRTGATFPGLNLRESYFGVRQVIMGADVQFSALRQIGGLEHRFVYGATLDYTQTSRPRYRIDTSLTTGASTSNTVTTGNPENFPNKNFPDTQTLQAAAYIQDTIQWGALRVIPAVRVDYYRLDPRPDAAFYSSAFGAIPVSSKSAVALSPKLGATYDLTENLRLFGQYARGFRAPPYDNANFAWANPGFGYEIIPNFNLRPETSDGFEAGLRGRFADGSSFQVSGFYNLYHDFINQVVVCMPPTCPLMQFQYQNLSSVRIWGIEAKGEWRITPEWTLAGAVAYARGTDQTTGAPIDSIDPLTGVVSLRYSNPTGWSVEGRMRAAAAKTEVSAANIYKPGGYATFDLLGSYEITPNVTVRAQILNIFNARYFNAIDVAGLTATSTALELYRAPGRSVAVSVAARF